MGHPAGTPLPPTETRSRGGLLKTLGVAFGVAVLVGNTIGMGILRTPGLVAENLHSVGAFLGVWVLGAGYALLGTLTAAELAAMNPRSGGPYTLVHDGLGPFLGFVGGWTDWVSGCGAAAAVSMVLGEYAGGFGGGAAPALTIKLIAAAVLVGLTLLQATGIRAGDVTQRVTSLLKGLALAALALVALVLGGGSAVADSAVAVPSSAPASAATAASFAAIVVALQSVIYTYDGWTGPIYFGEEGKDPGRELPRSMIAGVLVVMAIYLLLNLAFVRVLSLDEMAGDPFVAGRTAARLFGPAGDTVLRGLMIVSMFAAVNAMLLIGSRVPYAMSQDGLLPKKVGKVNRGGTPLPALIASTVVALMFVASNTLSSALAMIAFFFVANYAFMFTSLFVLRRREPHRHRPFRVPAYPLIPGLALLGTIAFLVSALVSDTMNSLIALALLGLSWPIYWAIQRRTTR